MHTVCTGLPRGFLKSGSSVASRRGRACPFYASREKGGRECSENVRERCANAAAFSRFSAYRGNSDGTFTRPLTRARDGVIPFLPEEDTVLMLLFTSIYPLQNILPFAKLFAPRTIAARGFAAIARMFKFISI